MSGGRREALVFGSLALAAVLAWALVPTYPNYDTYYHLVWGRELLDGRSPTFEAYQAPTQHPLWLAVGTLLAAVAGQDADRAAVLVAALGLVALVWGVFRTGRAVFGAWPGAVAALLAGSSFALLLYAARAYVDVPFLALVLWAAALEAARPRRGLPVMALLALAGLLRPEAWVLAGGYWLWCAWPGRGGRSLRAARPGLLGLALAAPVTWALVDLVVTGDPLWSLNATSDLADELGRERGLGAVPGAFVSFLVDTLRPPAFLAALAGLGLVVLVRPPVRPVVHGLHVPLGLLAAGILTFVATGVAGLSILPRYLTVPAIVLLLFAGFALAGWVSLPAGAASRRPWTAGVAVLAVAGVAFAIVRVDVVERLFAELRFVRGVHDDLVAALEDPAVRRDLRCGPLTFPNYRLVPDARWILDAPRGRVSARSAQRRERGVALFFPDNKTLRRYGFADGASPSTNAPDPGFVRIVRHGRIAAYSSCP